MRKTTPYVASVLLSCFLVAACGGGGGGGSGNDSSTASADGTGGSSGSNQGGSSQNSNAPAPVPVTFDNVLLANDLAANNVIGTINQAGIVRAYGIGSNQVVRIAAGSTPLSVNGSTATGSGWLVSGNTFEQSTVTLGVAPDGSSYTINAQSASNQVSDPNMQLASNITTPTTTALNGQYGVVVGESFTIDGASLSGTIDSGACTWSATLSPNSRTIDVTNINFQTAARPMNPTGTVCPYAGKTYTGTAFLLRPRTGYPNGSFDIIFDDSSTSAMPTTLYWNRWIKQ